jgi:hypothetical protein
VAGVVAEGIVTVESVVTAAVAKSVVDVSVAASAGSSIIVEVVVVGSDDVVGVEDGAPSVARAGMDDSSVAESDSTVVRPETLGAVSASSAPALRDLVRILSNSVGSLKSCCAFSNQV